MTTKLTSSANKLSTSPITYRTLMQTLGLLSDQKNIVVWARTIDYRQQLYLSKSFEHIWGRTIESIYEAPLSWNDSLVDDELNRKTFELCSRNPTSGNRERNTTLYRIFNKEKNEIRHIRDTCFHLPNSREQTVVIAGVAEWIDEETFHDEINALLLNKNKHYPEHILFDILENQNPNETDTRDLINDELPKHYVFLRNGNHVGLSTREYETLVGLMQGLSAKEIARSLAISPRTVEIYIENIKQKINFQKKSELFKNIHPAYLDLFFVEKGNHEI